MPGSDWLRTLTAALFVPLLVLGAGCENAIHTHPDYDTRVHNANRELERLQRQDGTMNHQASQPTRPADLGAPKGTPSKAMDPVTRPQGQDARLSGVRQ